MDVEILRQKYPKIDSFQFDFLNGDFSKLPECLQKIIGLNNFGIIKLLFYINPPYLYNNHNFKYMAADKYKCIGPAANELSSLFLARVCSEIPNACVAVFNKLSYLQGASHSKFREFFTQNGLKISRGFIFPANSFEGITVDYPISFFIFYHCGEGKDD